MTAFTTHCWKRRPERLIALLTCLLTLGVAQAGSIEPKSASLAPDEQGQAVSAEFAIKLGPRFEEAVERGVALHFRFEFALTRKRWYWADEHVAGRILHYKLNYQALTRQYRLSQGSQQQNFSTLDEALLALGRITRLHVISKADLVPGDPYHVAVRLSLDHDQLPKPLQVDALADRDWHIDAKTQRWDFVPSADK